jgi:hypothetical protein
MFGKKSTRICSHFHADFLQQLRRRFGKDNRQSTRGKTKRQCCLKFGKKIVTNVTTEVSMLPYLSDIVRIGISSWKYDPNSYILSSKPSSDGNFGTFPLLKEICLNFIQFLVSAQAVQI